MPNNISMNRADGASLLISCIAAAPCAGARRFKPRMVKLEKVKKAPAAVAAPMAQTMVMVTANGVMMLSFGGQRGVLDRPVLPVAPMTSVVWVWRWVVMVEASMSGWRCSDLSRAL